MKGFGLTPLYGDRRGYMPPQLKIMRLKVNPKLRARTCQKLFVMGMLKKYLSRPCQKMFVKTMFVETMFVKTMFVKISLSQHVLSTCFVYVNMFCQHVLSTFYFNVFRQYVSCFFNMFCQHALSTCFVYMFCWHVLLTCLLTCFVNMFCQRVSIFLHFKQNFHKNLRQTTTTTKKLVGLRE